MRDAYAAIVEELAGVFKPQRFVYALAYRENERRDVTYVDQLGREQKEVYAGGLEVRVLVRGTVANTKTVSWYARDFSLRYPDQNLEISSYPLDYCLDGIRDQFSKTWFRKATGTPCRRCGHPHDLTRHALIQLDELAEKYELYSQGLSAAAVALETYYGLDDDARLCLLYEETSKELAARIRLLHDRIKLKHT